MGHHQRVTRRQRAFVDALVKLGDPLAAYCEGFGYEANPVGDVRRQLAKRARLVAAMPAVSALLAEMREKGHRIPDMPASIGSPSPRQVLQMLQQITPQDIESMTADAVLELEKIGADVAELAAAELDRRRGRRRESPPKALPVRRATASRRHRESSPHGALLLGELQRVGMTGAVPFASVRTIYDQMCRDQGQAPQKWPRVSQAFRAAAGSRKRYVNDGAGGKTLIFDVPESPFATAQPHANAAAVGVDQFNTGLLQGGADLCELVQ